MFCQRCGAENPNEGRFCIQCGNALQELAGSVAAAPPPSGAAVTSGKAIGSLICGLLAFFPPTAIAAVVLGHLAISEIRKSAGRIRGEGMAVAGLVFGYMGLMIIPVFIVAAIAIPNLLRSRIVANEASAVGSLRTIEVATIRYAATYHNGFPPGLDALAGTGVATCDRAALIDTALASGHKDGYEFSYLWDLPEDNVPPAPSSDAAAEGCTMAGGTAYELHADPIDRERTGWRSFYTDQTGVIRFERDRPATASSPPIR